MFRDPPFPFVKPHRHPNSLVLSVALRGCLTLRQRRAFFIRMHQEARRLGIVLSHKRGLCVLYGAERICTTAHRHQMTNWLTDQAEVAQIGLGELGHLGDLFIRPTRPLKGCHDLTADDVTAFRALLLQVAGGGVEQWVSYLTGGMA